MNSPGAGSLDSELQCKLRRALERAVLELNSGSSNGASVSMEQFVDAFNPDSPTIGRLMAAVVKETLMPRKPSEPASPAASLRGGVPIAHSSSSFRGHSPAVDSSWTGSLRRGRNAAASVDLDHVRSLMEAVEIVSPHMVGADVVGGSSSPIPDARSSWALPGQAIQSHPEQHSLAGFNSSSDHNTHAVRHRRVSGQIGHSPGIPIRPLRPRARGHIDPLEFAEYAVAHMRPSPRFTPMGHGYPLSSSMTSESLPRSFRNTQPPLHLPRQHALEEMRNGANVSGSPADPAAKHGN